MTEGRIICLDGEFAFTPRQGSEMLELAIYDCSGRELYHSLFKPRRDSWMLEPHGIGPETVADAPYFDDELGAIQQIISEAEYVMGYAVNNDIRELEKAGVTGWEDKKVLEVRDWYNYAVNEPEARNFHDDPGLDRVAQALEVEFDADAHRADADTRVTLEVFRRLARKVQSRDDVDWDAIEQGLQLVSDTRNDFLRDYAAGYVSLVELSDGMTLRVGRKPSARTCVAEIAVRARFTAEYDLLSRFAPDFLLTGRTVFKSLKPRDINFFKNYSNEYDYDRETLCHSLLKRAH